MQLTLAFGMSTTESAEIALLTLRAAVIQWTLSFSMHNRTFEQC